MTLGWKNNSVFDTGPSKDTHWITTTGKGAIQYGGRRGAGSIIDHGAICSAAAMYNAAEGKVLTAGGAAQNKYKDDDGTVEDIINTSADITLLNQNLWAITYEVSGYFYSKRFAFVMNTLDDESYSIPSLQTTHLIPFMHF
ncbi:hypothetical protein GJ744_002741 [Endocarpon pusillum]|uniref:Uncharacterized protein n=1 Tax=Endocarpon pusillum TaxID=364733 RepID=A0A8H7AMX4_9EURO|nr:hypothetical protein GJ744_002741 [Endocarpon pusillum]